METLIIALLVSIIITILFLLFVKYKVNKIKKKEEEFNEKMDVFIHIPTGDKSTTIFKKMSIGKSNPRQSINYGYIVGIDPVYESTDDYKDNSGADSSSSDSSSSDCSSSDSGGSD